VASAAPLLHSGNQIMKQEYGFVYVWMDKKRKMFYVGCHWGTQDDGYVCSSNWMLKTYKRRPDTFKRRIVITNITSKQEMFAEELRLLQMIKPEEIKTKYYNFFIGERKHWSSTPDARTIAQKSGDTRRGRALPCKPGVAEKISASKKGKKFTEEHKAALKAARVGMKLSETHRKAISEGLKNSERYSK
jgi:hypothetical protein